MELFSLTKPQKSIWNMEQYYGGSVANITGSLLFEAPVEVQALQAALNKTLEQCDSLRIRVHMQDGTPMQYISPFTPCAFAVMDFSGQAAFDSWIAKLARTSFDLTGSLFKIYVFTLNGQVGIALHLHHLTADAWTLSLLANTIMRNLKDEVPTLGSYTYYLEEEQAYERSARHAKDKAYFMSCFEKCSEPVYLGDKQTASAEAKRLSITIDMMASQEIQAFCDDSGISPYALFMNALAIYLYRIKGAQDMFIGTTVLNRAGHQAKNTPGLFINTVPALMHIDESASALANLHQNTESISGLFRHQKYQYNDLLKDIRGQYGATDRLFDVMLNYQNAALEDGGMAAQWHFCGCQGESINIHINDRQHEDLFHVDYDYQTELFNEQDIARLHGYLMNLLGDIIVHPEKKPQELRLLSDAEYRRVMVEFNDTAVEFPQEKCVHQLFEEQVERTPDAVAVVFENEEYTYRQINEMANSLAHILRKKGVGRNDIVAIITKRSYKIIIAQFAVLKAGGAYLPIDPNYPKDRIAYMLGDAMCKTALTLGTAIDTVEAIDMSDATVFCGNTTPIENISTSGDLCYLIYTSGSTGLPKGTMLTHRNVGNYCNNNRFNVVCGIITDSMQSIVSITTIGFDIFVTESLLPLLNGKQVIFANEQQAMMQRDLNNLILETSADVLQTTPSKMELLIADDNFTAYLRRLKAIVLGGEALESRLVERLKLFTEASIYNIYGPTEATVWVTNALINSSAEITIGKPIANTQIHMLDKYLQPLPIGVAGELCIAGASVGAGYLNHTELTAEKFVRNPFGEGIMYRTGDLARWREDGNIVCVGRMDHQVKIRGLRIELGEIEAAIGQCENVKQTAVVVKTDEAGRQYICAYYVGDNVDVKAVKAQLVKQLPQYMVPHLFIQMEHFPATPSGKTDRKAFPVPDFAHIQSGIAYAPPASPLEKSLVMLMEKVLHIQKIGRDDDFFCLGGDSLKAIEFVSKASSDGVHFALQDVFDHPTAALLALHISEGSKPVTQHNEEDYAAIHQLLKGNTITDGTTVSKQSLGDVLITGATGWLGAHVLDAFLTKEQGTAYCLVRGADIADSQRRLHKTLDNYFGSKYAGCDRIVTLYGDITQPIVLEAPVNTIFHCAALVKHYGSYQASHDINVQGTLNVIALAKEKRARLLHISTTSVSGNSFDNDPDFPETVFSETSLFIGQPLENVYVRSKFEAEVAVLKARLDGLEAAVIRVGNLANRYADLKFQCNHTENATLTRLKAFIDLRAYPEQLSDFPLEFSPVDDSARAIITLARHYNTAYSVFHAYHNSPIQFSDIASAAKTIGLELHPVPYDQFTDLLQRAEAHIREAFIHDASEDGRLHLDSKIQVANSFTSWHLSRIGFHWPLIGSDYLKAYLQYFITIGYWRTTKQ